MANTLSHQVAEQIENKILSGEYKSGDSLPSERTLASEYGVSRNVLREAIKLLVQKKIVTNVVGKGNYVSEPDENDMVNMVEYTLDMSKIGMSEIVDAREEMELMLGLMIINMNPFPDFSDLLELCDEMEAHIQVAQEFIRLDASFHEQIVKKANNTPLRIFYRTLQQSISRKYYFGDRDNISDRKNALSEHREILKALINKDSDSYRTLIHQHLDLARYSHK